MKKELTFVLPDAIPAVSANKNLGKHRMVLSKEANKWKMDAWLLLKSQFHQKGYEPLNAPVKVYICYFFKDRR